MDIEKTRENRINYNQKLAGEDAFFARFGALDEETYAAGAIDKKHKELMGLSISVVTRCDECVVYHIEGCLKAGASRQEIIEAIKIGVIGGGSITYPQARLAIRVLEEGQP